jgi:hypothetical protein
MIVGVYGGLSVGAGAAWAEPRESVTFTNVNSDGVYASGSNVVRNRLFTGGYPVGSVVLSGTLRRVASQTIPYDSTIEVTSPGGATAYLYIEGSFGADGRVSVSGQFFEFYSVINDAAGNWRFRFYEDDCDEGCEGNQPGVDAVWETVTITLDDGSVPPPQPPVSENLGVIGETPISLALPLSARGSLWFRFEVPSGVSAPGFLDISTAGSSLSGDPESDPNDTFIALYAADGTLVSSNDNEPAGSFTSLLSYGAGSGGASAGQDGVLSPGVYYLAVGAYYAEVYDDFGDAYNDFVFDTYSTASGTIWLSLRTTRPCECTPLTITSEPADASASLLGQASFAVGFTGTDPTIQWQKDGREIPGASGPILVIDAAQASDAGRYRAVISNCCSTVTTRAATLTIRCPSDFNGDGFTDFFDYSSFVECFEGVECPPGRSADFNGDGFLDFFDYTDFLEEFEGNGRSFCSCLIADAPAGFAARPGSITATSAVLEWGSSGACDQTYEIDRSDDSGATYRRAAVVDAGTFSLDVTGLLPTSETRWRIRACRFDWRSNACGPWSEPVVVVRTPCVDLPAPGNVRVCNVFSTAVDVCWTVVGRGESGYIVERSTDGVNFTRVRTTDATTSRLRVSGLTSGQRYVFRVSTWVDSPSGFEDCITVGGTATATPDCVRVPGSWRVVSTTSSSVCFLWTDTSTCETRFVIQQSVWNGSDWGPAQFGENVPGNRGDACRTGLASATRYRFRIRAEIEGGRVSDWSEWREATTGADCLQPPGNFRVGSVSGNQICLLWADTSSCEDRFVIQQSVWNGGSWGAWEFGENVPGNRGDACRTGLAYNTRYRFRIRAEIAGVRESGWSDVVEATTGDDCLQPPGNYRVASVSGNQVCFLWNDTSSCETRFVIEQSRWNGSAWEAWTFGENVPGNRGDACRTGLAYNTRYRFRIRAEIEGVRQSGWSGEVEATTQADCLQTPGNFRVLSTGCGSVRLGWSDTSSCEVRYEIEQSRWNGSAWGARTFGENVPGDATSATRDGLAADGLYRFWVRAVSQDGRSSDWAGPVEARATPGCLDRPTNLRRGTVTPTSVELLWNDNSSCETQFQIYQRRFTNGSWGDWVLGENVPANAERAIRDGNGSNPIVRGGRYQFYVIADQGDCESEWSNIVEVDLPN